MLFRYEEHHWWYHVRREIIHQLISKYRTMSEELRIADIGCGAGLLSKELEMYGMVTDIDPSQQSVSFTRSRGLKDVRLGSAEETGCSNDEFDIVLCLDVLEHLKEDLDGILEIKRILKPGGIAIIFVPAFHFLWSITDEVSHHFRRYRLPQLFKKFEQAGFSIQKYSYFNTILFLPIALIRITVRILHLNITSEAETGSGVINRILYRLFSLERKWLANHSLPFGVSIMYVIRK